LSVTSRVFDHPSVSVHEIFLIAGDGLLCAICLQAQRSPVASGGTATGSGGSATYSVGQVTYTAITGTPGSAIQGVHQPFEISIVTSVPNPGIDLQAIVYPNPTKDQVMLRIGYPDIRNLQYILLDAKGALIKQNPITRQQTLVTLPPFGNGVYLLQVWRKQSLLITFKIVKAD